ncbi:NAD(P)/FAD-dependent oxidoreductase [Streptomyces sp. ST2-7A]|uniref:NAD(P)/FAD-dependent oxidoreductase n=1 Tax=Streptomyces sp. ST2-7A TaxID=2907214 RepID=UPI001F3EE965|nr:NAD(P)/FAD-dependent oxidoreductase [Streptomyces sp. ST2-7A]MCE7082273.1 NAD(P)/FAD-dependent oxidoreductase [Streptomyces sp. ST2-7A]
MTVPPASTGTPAPTGSPAATHHEVVVIGGGPAGLAGATALARARRSVLLVDAGAPRNAPAGGVHNYLGHEGTPPGQLLAIGRKEVTGYGGRIVEGTVTRLERLTGGAVEGTTTDGEAADAEPVGPRFRVGLGDGTTVTADRLLITTGLIDELPDVPGVAEGWGHDVLHCPYCHGWEVRDRAIGILSTGPMGVHQALMWRQWSEDVTLFVHTGPEPDEEEYEQLAARGVAVVDGRVTELRIERGRLRGVVLEDGHVIGREAVIVAPRFTARGGLLADLGITPVDQEVEGHVIGSHITADPTGATEVPGVWVAGNVGVLTEQVIGSAAAGMRAGSMINADLIKEETRRAVAARRRSARETAPVS